MKFNNNEIYYLDIKILNVNVICCVELDEKLTRLLSNICHSNTFSGTRYNAVYTLTGYPSVIGNIWRFGCFE